MCVYACVTKEYGFIVFFCFLFGWKGDASSYLIQCFPGTKSLDLLEIFNV